MADFVIQFTCESPSAAPTTDEAWEPVSLFLADKVAIATLWFSHLGEACVKPSPIQESGVRFTAPRDCHAKT